MRIYQQTLLLLGLYTGASFRAIPSINRILRASQQIKMHEYLFDPLRNYLFFQKRYSSSAHIFHESIELKNISFAYPHGPPMFQNTSPKIRKGEKIAITGKSGKEKPTGYFLSPSVQTFPIHHIKAFGTFDVSMGRKE